MVISTKHISGAAATITITALFLLLSSGCGQKNAAPAARGGSGGGKVAVEACLIQPRLLQNTISTTGTLLANEDVELRSEISGRITGIFFEEGKRVKKDELLLKINDSDLQAQLKRKEFEEKQASDQENRQKKLREINVVSQEDYDRDLNALRMIQAEKEALQAQLAKTEVRAPFDGIIGLRYVSVGGYVSPSMLIATVQDVDPMKVEFSAPEKYAGQLKPGTEIRVQAGDSPEKRVGAVYALEAMIDTNTRTIKARAKIPNSGGNLIPGAFAKVDITLNEVADAIVIPSGAVIPRINDEIVYVCRGGLARLTPVVTGIRTDSGTQITQGLNPGDTLIVNGLLQLADGKAVQIKTLIAN